MGESTCSIQLAKGSQREDTAKLLLEEASERTRNNRHRLQLEKCSLKLSKKSLVWKDISSLKQVSQRDCEIPILGDFFKLNWTESWTTEPKQHNLLKTALLWVGAKVGACQGPVSPEVFYDRYTVPLKLPVHLNPATDAPYGVLSATLEPLQTDISALCSMSLSLVFVFCKAESPQFASGPSPM